MSILEDIEFEQNMKEYKEVARKRSEGLVEKLQRYNHEAKIRYGYIPADTPPPNSTPASLSKKKKK